jgi:16S rRNA (cytidine1402-2'-O)-methyltransferase
MAGVGQSEWDAHVAGRLILAATPLGNPGDATVRLAEALGTASVIAAEDTRRLRRLASDLGVSIPGRIVSLHDSVEAQRTEGLLQSLLEGEDVLVVTDAGMPAVSDPGFRLVRACIDADIDVVVLPGPSAVLAALVVSGLAVDRFCFEGFCSRKAGERRRHLESLAAEQRTMVFFESPHRIAATLADMVEIFGAQRPAVLARELTKTHEEVIRGDLTHLVERAAAGLRGEITLVIAGAPASPARTEPAEWVTLVSVAEEAGIDRRSAIADVARELGVPRREVYDAVVAARHRGEQP